MIPEDPVVPVESPVASEELTITINPPEIGTPVSEFVRVTVIITPPPTATEGGLASKFNIALVVLGPAELLIESDVPHPIAIRRNKKQTEAR